MDIGERARAVVKRLSELDTTDDRIDAGRAEHALNEYLRVVGVFPRRVRWAHGAQRGLGMSQGATFEGEADELKETERLGAYALKNSAWEAARREAERAARAISWMAARSFAYADTIPMEAVPHHPMALARRNTWHRQNWIGAGSALDCAVTAAAQCAGIHAAGRGLAEEVAEEAEQYARMLLPFADAWEAGVWLFWVADREVIAVRRPVLHLEGTHVHRDGQPAIVWPDGECYYILHGVRVYKKVVMTLAEDLDPRMILGSGNVSVRREIVRKIGLERILSYFGAECVDEQGDYELLLLEFDDGRRRPFLKMRNPSTGDYHIEGVAPYCYTVAEALAWRNDTDVPPAMLT